jgi:alkyl hydroperoxide reductase subunit AhpC
LPDANSKISEFSARNAEVFGVSMDSIHTNKAFADSVGGLNYPILADWLPHGSLTDALGIRVDKLGCSNRTTVIVDKDGVIRDIDTHPLGEDRDFAPTIAKLDAISKGLTVSA